jgi:hypothetical protein
MTDEIQDDDGEKSLLAIKAAASRLMEQFGLDSIQVFATKAPNREGTRNFSWGLGNFFTRYGYAKSWVLRHEGEEMRKWEEEEG